MKSLFFAVVAIIALGSTPFGHLTLSAQDSQPADAAEQVGEEMLSLPWLLDVAKAKARAKAEGKDLFINFTGSDWCGWCKRLDSEVFGHAMFQDASKKDFVFLYLDFPMSDEAKAKVIDTDLNEKLRADYGVQGFPTILLTDADGNPYARTGYQPGGPEAYKTHLGELRTSGAKIKSLLTNSDAAQQAQLLEAAFPVLAAQELLGYSGYNKYLEAAEGVESLKGPVAKFKANQKLQEFLSGNEEPDWDKVHDFLKKHDALSGPMFLNACWATATMHLTEKKEFDAAIALLNRMLADPLLEGNEQGHKMISDKIAEIAASKNGGGEHDGHDHDDHDHDDHDHDDHDHDDDHR